MRYALPVALAAGPALGHTGAHLHPHSIEGWLVGLGIVACVIAAGAVLRGRWPRK